MRKLVFLLISIAYSISMFPQITSGLSREEAWEIVKENVLKNKTEGVNVYVCDTITNPWGCFKTVLGKEKTPTYRAWFFFIDDFPNANWDHPCRYVFVNIENGRSEIFDRVRPPYLDRMISVLKYKGNTDLKLNEISVQEKESKHIKSVSTNPIQNNHNYAVIINGGINKYNNHFRYWNDCSLIYKTLINTYNYNKDNIFVLMSDGTSPADDRLLLNGTFDSSPLDLDNDGIDDIQYAATPTNIHNVFTTLSNTLTSSDTLFIFTMDHGGQTNGNSVYLYLWNGSTISDVEFATEVNRVNAGKMIFCMGQCHSGGFIDNLQAPGRVIMTACDYDEFSYGSSYYDTFVNLWTNAINGTVGADSNSDGFVSIHEAFLYAENYDTEQETPQYSASPLNCGDYLTLSNYFWGEIEGNHYVYESEIFRIKNLSPLLSINWVLTGYHATNFILQNNGQSCTITRIDGTEFDGSANLTLSAQIMLGSNLLATVSRNLIAPYIDGPLVPCGVTVYSVTPVLQNTTVSWSADGQYLDYYIAPGVQPLADPNEYVINPPNNVDVCGTLTATVKAGNNVLGVLDKFVDTSGGFSGTWYQQAILNDTINSTPKPFFHNSLLEFVPNRTVYLSSDHFNNATISHSQSGVSLIGWSNSNGVISFDPFQPINYTGSSSIIIEGTAQSGCKKFRLQLFSPPSLIDDPILLAKNPDGSTYEFSISEDLRSRQDSSSESSNPLEWRLTIIKIDSANRVFDEIVRASSISVNVSGWPRGIYIAIAQIKDQYYSLKFSVGD